MINKELLITFVILNILNVMMSTIKSLCTIKCGKGVAALVNALSYGLYTVVVVYTVCDLPLMVKVIIVSFANLVGVYIVKYLEEKGRKDKLWKVEVVVPIEQVPKLLEECKHYDLFYNYIDISKYYLFNFYCQTQQDSHMVKGLLKPYDVRYFVAESKVL